MRLYEENTIKLKEIPINNNKISEKLNIKFVFKFTFYFYMCLLIIYFACSPLFI